MSDLMYIAIVAGFFVIAAGYTLFCGKI